jgi:hypothetical protein
MYSVEHEWDRLKVCVVGSSYPTSFYDWIPNHRVRDTMQHMASVTCAGLDRLLSLLDQFGVYTIRPRIPDQADPENFPLPPQQPRDYMFMAGDVFCYRDSYWHTYYNNVKAPDWLPYDTLEQFLALAPAHQIQDLMGRGHLESELKYIKKFSASYQHIVDHVRSQGNQVINLDWADGGQIMRLGQQWIWGTDTKHANSNDKYQQLFPGRQHHVVSSAGHIDGIFCVPKPGLLIAVDEPNCWIDYEHMLPGWKIYRLPGNNLMRDLARSQEMQQFLDQTQGRWWIPGMEHDQTLTQEIESRFQQWFGYSWESSYDVNMLCIDNANVITTAADPQLLDILVDNDITPHVLPDFSTLYFWDGGIHCMTAELHREPL